MGAPQQLKVLGWRTPTAGLCCGLAAVSQVWWEPWVMTEVDECRILWERFGFFSFFSSSFYPPPHNSTAILKIYKCILNVQLQLSDLLFFSVSADRKFFLILFFMFFTFVYKFLNFKNICILFSLVLLKLSHASNGLSKYHYVQECHQIRDDYGYELLIHLLLSFMPVCKLGEWIWIATWLFFAICRWLRPVVN